MTAAEIQLAGAGRAYQSVAQSTAIAIQDGTDYLRNVSTIAVTAIGVAMAQMAATNGGQGQKLLDAATKLVSTATTQFGTIASTATTVATGYPGAFG